MWRKKRKAKIFTTPAGVVKSAGVYLKSRVNPSQETAPPHIRRSGDHVDLGDVRRVIRPSGAPKVRVMFSCSLSERAASVPRGGKDGY